jgi:hypothetical protein
MASIIAAVPKLGATLWFRQVVFFPASMLSVSSTWFRAAVSREGRWCSLTMGWPSL